MAALPTPNVAFTPYILRQGIPYQNNAEDVDVNGAILSVSGGQVYINKATAATITLAAPIGTGARLVIYSTTAAAHVVTAATALNGGANNTMTFAATIGSGIVLISRELEWYVEPGGNTGVTLSTV